MTSDKRRETRPVAALSLSRRKFVATAAAAAALPAIGKPMWDGAVMADALGSLFQRHYRSMDRDEIDAALQRIESRAKRRFGVDIECTDTPAQAGVVFGYAINVARCKGYRDCVHACMAENNQGDSSELQYIRVLELDRGETVLEHADHYYDPELVPRAGKYYLPVQCMQCDDPPCVNACPVNATWQEPDGIVVVDYDWCIGCRYCMAACPYWARHFNWARARVEPEDINPETHYLGNRPREKGVVEKCHCCVQRTRKGRQPACMEACPTGARIFGNLLDPGSELRYVLENKHVYRLKEELGTEPKLWYFAD